MQIPYSELKSAEEFANWMLDNYDQNEDLELFTDDLIDPWGFYAWLDDTHSIRHLDTLELLADYVPRCDSIFDESYRGEYRSLADYVEEFYHDTYEIPEELERYINWDDIWECELRYDYSVYFDGSDYHIFLNY